MNSTEQSAGSQFSLMRSTDSRKRFGQLRLDRAQILVEPIEGVLLAGRRDHQHRQAGHATFGLKPATMSSGSETFVPPQPVPGSATWK